MKPENLTPDVLAKLGFMNPKDFDVKPDGELVILDKTYQKFKFAKKDYENLLKDGPQMANTTEKPYMGKRRGRKPKKQLIADS